MNIVERVTAFKLQTQALDEAASGQTQNATRRLRAAATMLLDLGEQELAQNAIQQAQQMEQGGQMDPGAAQAMRYKTKLLTENITQQPLSAITGPLPPAPGGPNEGL
jgi:Ca-activated chloride channel family protein